MTTYTRRLAGALALAICFGALSAEAQADPAGKWRVEFEHYTGSDGAIVRRVSLEGNALKFDMALASSSLTGLAIRINRE